MELISIRIFGRCHASNAGMPVPWIIVNEPSKRPFSSHTRLYTVQESIPITQFLQKLTVPMPSAVKAMEFTAHLPHFHVDLVIAVVEPLYAKLWHGPQIYKHLQRGCPRRLGHCDQTGRPIS